MIYAYPKLGSSDQDVLGLIRGLRDELRFQVNNNPIRWTGFLRRTTFARALQGSNSIEGINANLDEAVAIIDEERPESLEEETIRALSGYRTAMTYIARLHDDPHLEINAQLIRSLHFMLLSYDMTKLPGQWRTGPIFVVREPTKEQVYEGPPADAVPGLIDELVQQANSADVVESPTVLGAMAHLNLAMIHPFKDGNGRMARALQTLLIARNGAVSPVFSSIEEWLGRNTDEYYNLLAQVGQGRWSPRGDALPWVQFCLRAHYQQAATIKRRNTIIGRVWIEVTQMIADLGLPPRTEVAMMDAAFGYRVRSQRYRSENSVSDVVASRDFKRLTDRGILIPVGEKRGRYYEPGQVLKEIRQRCDDKTRPGNPYELIRASPPGQLSLRV